MPAGLRGRTIHDRHHRRDGRGVTGGGLPQAQDDNRRLAGGEVFGAGARGVQSRGPAGGRRRRKVVAVGVGRRTTSAAPPTA